MRKKRKSKIISEPVRIRYDYNLPTQESDMTTELLFDDVTKRADLTQFADSHLISEENKEAVAWLVSAGIMKGTENGQFNPLGYTTRAEISTVIQRIMQLD